jgi:Chlamydia polymorphic membrane protein (Chlamydia_PMP) repeat
VTVVDGNGLVTGDRVFQITSSATKVSLTGLTIRNGKKDAGAFDEGGGLYWDGAGSQLNLTDVVIENNTASYGGGLYLNYSSLGDVVNLDHVVIRGNSVTAAAGGLGVNFGDYAGFHLLDSQVYNNTAYEGGGVYFQGTTTYGLSSVSIENSQIYANTASLSAGFENHSGDTTVPVILLNTDLYQNSASYYGGAIGNYGALAISTSTMDANTATVRGGGIYNYEGGHIDISQSTLSDNSAQFGGGIYTELFVHNAGTITMTNSTLSGNSASRDGGGIYAVGGQISLYNATIARNLVLVPSGVTYPGMGAGVYITGTATINTLDTLLGDNTHQYQVLPPEQDDCFGLINSLGYNLIQQPSNCTLSGTTVGVITGLDPRLGTLQNNGGLTRTLSPFSGSPEIDAGQMPYCTDANGAPLTTDQRSAQRPLGAGCDIGAVESLPYSVYLSGVQR